jgi:hypothetical protein
MLTKRDLNKLVTKKEFHEKMRAIDERFDGVDKRFDDVDKKFWSVDKKFGNIMKYIDNRFNEFEEKMYTKKDHEIFMIWMDEAMKELRDCREERVLSEQHILRLDDKTDNHEKRLCVLERK